MSTNIMIISTINKTYKLLFIFTLYYITFVIICLLNKNSENQNTQLDSTRTAKNL